MHIFLHGKENVVSNGSMCATKAQPRSSSSFGFSKGSDQAEKDPSCRFAEDGFKQVRKTPKHAHTTSFALIRRVEGIVALKRSEKAVLLNLALRADGDGYCYPSEERIASDTGYGRRTVGTALRVLQERGYIFVGQRIGLAGHHNAYVITRWMAHGAIEWVLARRFCMTQAKAAERAEILHLRRSYDGECEVDAEGNLGPATGVNCTFESERVTHSPYKEIEDPIEDPLYIHRSPVVTDLGKQQQVRPSTIGVEEEKAAQAPTYPEGREGLQVVKPQCQEEVYTTSQPRPTSPVAPSPLPGRKRPRLGATVSSRLRLANQKQTLTQNYGRRRCQRWRWLRLNGRRSWRDWIGSGWRCWKSWCRLRPTATAWWKR